MDISKDIHHLILFICSKQAIISIFLYILMSIFNISPYLDPVWTNLMIYKYKNR